MNEFERRVAEVDPAALYATSIEVLQLNLGLRCNLRCLHCHHQSSPERTEVMPPSIVAGAIDWARSARPRLVDVTGGAPELHPQIRELVVELRHAGLEVQIRTNLTLLLEPPHEDLPELWARHGVRLLASLPSPDAEATERQRGGGTFARSIAALRRLNAVGYGTGDGGRLDLASNPYGMALPERTRAVEAELRHELGERFGVRFTSLLMLTNMPIGRQGAWLDQSSRRALYLDSLRAAFNPATVPLLACRRTLAVAWDGRLFDCDFNLAAGLPVRCPGGHLLEAAEGLASRRLHFGLHCFACTAHAGSS